MAAVNVALGLSAVANCLGAKKAVAVLVELTCEFCRIGKLFCGIGLRLTRIAERDIGTPVAYCPSIPEFLIRASSVKRHSHP